MNTRARRQAILTRLKEVKSICLADIAAEFNVSTMTIRRDLRRMAEQEIVTLVHGGAVLNEGTASLPAVKARTDFMRQEKSRIAVYCASLVQEGNAIFLDTGSTAAYIAECLQDRQNIAVLTNSILVMNILAHAKGIQLIAIGGFYSDEHKGFFGDVTRRTLEGFHIDIAFCGAGAIDIDKGITSQLPEDGVIKQTMRKQSRQIVIAIDHSKIGSIGFIKICNIADVDKIVTDKKAPAAFIEQAQKLGTPVICC